MSQDLKQHYRWYAIKRDIMKFMAKCLNCQTCEIQASKTMGFDVENVHSKVEVRENYNRFFHWITLSIE